MGQLVRPHRLPNYPHIPWRRAMLDQTIPTARIVVGGGGMGIADKVEDLLKTP